MDATLLPAAMMAAGAGWIAVDRVPQHALARAATTGWATLVVTAAILALTVAGVLVVPFTTLVTLTLTAFIGAIVLSFSRRYLRADAKPRGYAVKVTGLLAAVMLFAAAHDLITMAIGWIASGWLLAALIGHVAGWQEARRSSRLALFSFAVGDAALAAAIAIVIRTTGSITLPSAIAATPLTDLAAALIVIAAAVRSALPPLHRWLARSMTAPTPVSALMHAGFVNGGGVLLIGLAPVLESAPVARLLAIALGLVAALVGATVMLVRPDVKRSLAGSTTAQMGFMLMTCGLGAYAAALWHIAAHGLFKAWLFLRSGSAIGIEARPVPVALPPATVAGIGIAAVGGTAALAYSHALPVAAVPIILAIATALASVPHLGRSALLAVTGAGVVGAYAAGLVAFDRLIGLPGAPVIGGTALPVVIVAIFMSAWLVQALALAGKFRLPAALHARLLNS